MINFKINGVDKRRKVHIHKRRRERKNKKKLTKDLDQRKSLSDNT